MDSIKSTPGSEEPRVGHLRVLHVINQPDGGGAERVVRELNRTLPHHGVESRVVYFCNPRRRPLESTETELGCAGPRDWRAALRLERYLNDFNSDEWIVHAHLTRPLYLVGALPRARRFRRVYTEHSTWNRRRKHGWLRYVERFVYSRYDRLACVSRGALDALRGWLGDDIVSSHAQVVGNGGRLLAPKRDFTPPSNGVRLISVGSLYEHKGLACAIEALAHVESGVKRYTLVGTGPERANLAAHAEKLGLTDKVQFLGWREDVGDLLRSADILLVPSRWEGFCLSAMEGLSVGLPMVTSDVPGLSDVVGNLPGVLRVEQRDPRSLAAAIDRMVEARDEWPNYAPASVERARLYSIENMARGYARLYRRIANEAVEP